MPQAVISAGTAVEYETFGDPADPAILLIAGSDGERRVVTWDLDSDHLIEAACRLAGRNLTATEWAAYLAAFGAPRDTCPSER